MTAVFAPKIAHASAVAFTTFSSLAVSASITIPTATQEYLPLLAKYAPIIEQYAQHLRLNGKKEVSINVIEHRLILLIKNGADLDNPETVKQALLKAKWQQFTKHATVSYYTGYLKFTGKTWEKPKYTPQEKLYFIPTEQEIDTLISASNKTIATLLQFLKETATRIGEATQVMWSDIDTQNKTVAIQHPEKGSLPRLIPMSDKLILMLNTLPKTEKPIFLATSSKHGLTTTFEKMRNRTAKKLQNPRLKQIHFHTFRHWKATTMFLQLHDSYEVRRLLGHKTAVMTDRYINIAKTLMKSQEEQWVGLVTNSIEEELNAVNNGYILVRAINETKALYRKRK